MPSSLPPERLLRIIETQNDISATRLDVGAVMALVAARAQGLTDAAAAVVELVDGDSLVYRAACGSAAAHTGTRLPVDASLSGLCVRENQVLSCHDARADARVNREMCEKVGAISLLCVPLRHGPRVVGVLKVYDTAPNAFDEDDVTTLSLLSGVIAAHMAHAADFEIQQHESRHDAMTGLPNWRAFDERLGSEVARVHRHGGAVAVAVIDLDGFKAVNDDRGHAAGDEVLRAVARHLRRVREEDSAFRIGGDEFALILVGAEEDTGVIVLERLAEAVAADPACAGIELSSGLAGLCPEETAASLLARADRAMYASKAVRRAAGRRHGGKGVPAITVDSATPAH